LKKHNGDRVYSTKRKPPIKAVDIPVKPPSKKQKCTRKSAAKCMSATARKRRPKSNPPVDPSQQQPVAIQPPVLSAMQPATAVPLNPFMVDGRVLLMAQALIQNNGSLSLDFMNAVNGFPN
jgi:hypothetical protein